MSPFIRRSLAICGALAFGGTMGDLHSPPSGFDEAFDPNWPPNWSWVIGRRYFQFPDRSFLVNSEADYVSTLEDLSARFKNFRNSKWLSNAPIPLPESYAALASVDLMLLQTNSNPVREIPKLLLNKPRAFSLIRSMNRWDLWLRPSFSVGRFHSDKSNASFDLKSYGALLGTSLNFNQRFLVGLSAGYTYSKAAWSSANDRIHSVIFQPYATYLFQRGYIYFATKLLANRHELQRSYTATSQESVSLASAMNSIDASIRAKGGCDIPLEVLAQRQLYLRPNVALDWDLVFSGHLQESGGYSISRSFSSFLQATVGLQLRGEFLGSQGAFIPMLDVGWNSVISSSNKAYKVGEQTMDKDMPKSNQLLVGVGVNFFHARAILIGASYQAHLFGRYRRQRVELSLEFDW